MQTRRKWIAVVALAGILAAVVMGVVTTRERSKILVDTGATRAAVESSIRNLIPKSVESGRDPRLISAAELLSKEPYVASAWVVNQTGEIVFHQGGPGKQGDRVQDLAQDDMARALEALEAHVLSESQKLQLLAVGAVRREGEHNDVFRHLAYEVADGAGRPAALVVLAYDANPLLGQPDGFYIVSLLIGIVGFATYWLALPLWVYLDARARGDAAALWCVFVLFTNLVGLVAYLIVITQSRHLRQADLGTVS